MAPSPGTLPRLVRAGLLTGIIGGLFACALSVASLLLHRPPRIGRLWWVELPGHIPFVGLPIVASIGDTTA